MVQLTRIYTKGGDRGKTSLGSGTRVVKYDLRIEAIGAVDEANAALGLILCSNKTWQAHLIQLQNDLFDVGADLCFPEKDKPQGALKITKDYVVRLEAWIDEINANLAPLTSFVLPAGSLASRSIHLARTIVRRAERVACALLAQEEGDLNLDLIAYLNRLSDFLFVLARAENNMGTDDVLWCPGALQKETPTSKKES